MKITIEIDHKTTQNDIERLIGALQSVYTAPEPKEENIQLRKEQIDPNLREMTSLFSERQHRDQNEAPVSDSIYAVREYKPVQKVYEYLNVPRSKAWIYHLVREKKISSRIQNKRVYVSQKEIEEYYNSHK